MKKSNKLTVGIVFGTAAGIIDIMPMIMQKLSLDALLSAFSLWVMSGFIISTSNLKMNPILKGVLISFAVLIPAAILIGWKEPISLIPIGVMTLILGSVLGFSIEQFSK
jgi:hypothetical protein